MLVAEQVASDALDRRDEARVVGLDEAEVVHRQETRIHLGTPETLGERLLLLIPGALENLLPDRSCRRPPVRSPVSLPG